MGKYLKKSDIFWLLLSLVIAIYLTFDSLSSGIIGWLVFFPFLFTVIFYRIQRQRQREREDENVPRQSRTSENVGGN